MKDVWQMARVWAVPAIVGLLTALAGSCGGGGEPQVDTSPTLPTGEDAALAPCRALQDLQAYRYSANIKLESPEPGQSPAGPRPTPTSTLTREFAGLFLFEYVVLASFVAPDRTEALITEPGIPLSMIVIGNQTWIHTGTEWMLTGQAAPVPYRPPDICEAVLPNFDLSQIEPQEEEVNDVKSLHYSFSQVSSPEAMAEIFGSASDMAILIKTLDMDLWLAEKDGWPVRMDIGGSGLYADGRELWAHILIDIRDANSSDIRVEAPS